MAEAGRAPDALASELCERAEATQLFAHDRGDGLVTPKKTMPDKSDTTDHARMLTATPHALPSGLTARVWINPGCFFSSGRADDSCWLWLLRTDGRVQALRLSNASYSQDALLVPLLAWLDTASQTSLHDDDTLGSAWLLPTAPVVPTLRWAITWGHPLQQAIRQFAGLLDEAVLAGLGQLETAGAYCGSTSNYNRLTCLPNRVRRHRLQALALFPPLVAPLLLDGHDRPDMFGNGDHADTTPARFTPTQQAPVLDAMDHGRDLIGALARHWHIDRSLVRAPLSRQPWQRGCIDAGLLQLLNAMPAHRRPRTRDDIEPVLSACAALPAQARTPAEQQRLAQAFEAGWVETWQHLQETFPPLENRLRDCRDFLHSAQTQVDWIELPAWLDANTLALGWLARRGVASLLAASARWHDQPLTELADMAGVPQQLEALLGDRTLTEGRVTELLTARALRDEGDTMHHCVGEYWDQCLIGPTRLLHLARANGEVATAQYDCHGPPGDPRFALVELRGRFNEDSSDAMQAFAEHAAEQLNAPSLDDKRIELLAQAQQWQSTFDSSGIRQTIRLLDRQSRHELRRVIACCLQQPDWRALDDVLYRGVVAGFGHAGGLLLKNAMQQGDALALVREPDNPHDEQAVRIDWQGQKIGYVPRQCNPAIARQLDAGNALQAAIDHIRHDGSITPVDCIVSQPTRRPT